MDVVQKPDESCLLALMQQTDKKGLTWLGEHWFGTFLASWLLQSSPSNTPYGELRARHDTLMQTLPFAEICQAASRRFGFYDYGGDYDGKPGAACDLFLLVGVHFLDSFRRAEPDKLSQIQILLAEYFAAAPPVAPPLTTAAAAAAAAAAATPTAAAAPPPDVSKYTSLLKEKGDRDGIQPVYTEEVEQMEPILWRVTASYGSLSASASARSKKTAKHLASHQLWLRTSSGWP